MRPIIARTIRSSMRLYPGEPRLRTAIPSPPTRCRRDKERTGSRKPSPGSREGLMILVPPVVIQCESKRFAGAIQSEVVAHNDSIEAVHTQLDTRKPLLLDLICGSLFLYCVIVIARDDLAFRIVPDRSL